MPGFINDFKCLDCKHCFKRSANFSLLNDSELALLDKDRMEVSFKEGEIIYKQGTPLTHIVIIHDGLGKIFIESPNGRNLILSYTKEYDLNGGVGVFIDQRHYSSLRAVTDCGACFIEINAFKSVLRSNPAFMEAYIREYSMRVLHTYQQFAVLTQKNMEGRMAESILYLTSNIFKDGAIKYVSKQDLAELTAMTKESAIRVLKDFKEDGLIEIVDHKINILDQKALEQVAKHG
ncbi:MAG: Crp/Fnr family transcriptional regulator [Cyclobacteriaceae bacterium]|nr:Crp/Fnr family transcriptional regulator [Cyclobacteriaceae bacterium]